MKITYLWSLLLVNTLFAKPPSHLTQQQTTVENLQTLLRDIAFNVDFSHLNIANIHKLPILNALQYFLIEPSRRDGAQVMETLSFLITQMHPNDLAKLEILFAPRRNPPADSTIAFAAMEIKLNQSIQILSQTLASIKPKNTDVKRPADFSLGDVSLWLQNTQSFIKEYSIAFKRNQLKTFFQASPKGTFSSNLPSLTLEGQPIYRIPLFQSLNYLIKYSIKPSQEASIVSRMFEILDVMSSQHLEHLYRELIKVPAYEPSLGRQHYKDDNFVEVHQTLIYALKLLNDYNDLITSNNFNEEDLLREIIKNIKSLLQKKLNDYDYQSFLIAENTPLKDESPQNSNSRSELSKIFDTNISTVISLDSLRNYSKSEALILLLTLGSGRHFKSKNRILPYKVIENLKELIGKFSEEEVQTALTKLETHPEIPEKIDYYDGYLNDFCLVNTTEPLDFILDLLINYNDSAKNSKKDTKSVLQASKKLLQIYLKSAVNIKQFKKIQTEQAALKSKK